MALRIVTDSTADLPADFVRELDITVVPLNVHFGDAVFRDGIDLTTNQFFMRLSTSDIHPTTSQPSIGAFLETYRFLLGEGHDILSLHVSGKLSGTMNSALVAQRELQAGSRLEVVDTGLTSMALGLVVLDAARAAKRGVVLAEAADQARTASSRTHLQLFLETLEFLRRGGRIGRAQAFLGGILSFKPIIQLRDGEVHPVERVRTRGRAVERLIEWARGHSNIQEIAVLYSTTPEEAASLAGRLRSIFPEAPVVVAQYGPVVGVHVGPGGMAIVIRENDPL